MAISNTGRESIRAKALKFGAERESYFKKVKYNFDAHNKHILGHNDYDGVRSIFTHPEPEKLLRNFGGKGLPRRGVAGESGFKETIDFKEIIVSGKITMELYLPLRLKEQFIMEKREHTLFQPILKQKLYNFRCYL